MAKRKPAAVMGSLVNLKNVSTHKCIALTIHIPAEAAQAVLAAFGWPTMVDPVPVAVARLEESASLTQPLPEYDKEAMQRERLRGMQNVYAEPPAPEEKGAEANRRLAEKIDDRRKELERFAPGEPAERARLNGPPVPTRHWSDMTPAQQTGVIRNEKDFWDFAGVDDVELARDYIRMWCGVESCADILPGTRAAVLWAQLQVRYGNWLRSKRGAA